MTIDEQAGSAERTTPQLQGERSSRHRTIDRGTSEGQPSGFDIGVSVPQAATAQASLQGATQRRRLPTWVLVAVALLAGWLLGSLLGASEPATPAIEAPAAPALPTPVPTAASATAPSTPGSTDNTALSLPVTTLVLAPQRQGPPGPSMLLVDDSGSAEIMLDGGPVTAQPLLVDKGVAAISGGTVYIVPTDAGASIAVTEADVLMPGSGSATLWAVRPNRRTVQLIDVDTRSVRATYDLATVGAPLGSYDGGLVVAPDIERFGPFALWSPARGIERIWSLDEDAEFVDAGASTIVVRTDQGLASYDTVTGSLSQTEMQFEPTELAGATVSPDGDAVAVLTGPTSGQPTSIAVVDLATGEIADRFEAGFDAGYWWVSSDQILHRDVDDPQQIWLRNTRLGFSTRVVRTEVPFAWMALGG